MLREAGLAWRRASLEEDSFPDTRPGQQRLLSCQALSPCPQGPGRNGQPDADGSLLRVARCGAAGAVLKGKSAMLGSRPGVSPWTH